MSNDYNRRLAQAFARYFMRVGLPHDAKAFEKEGEVKEAEQRVADLEDRLRIEAELPCECNGD